MQIKALICALEVEYPCNMHANKQLVNCENWNMFYPIFYLSSCDKTSQVIIQQSWTLELSEDYKEQLELLLPVSHIRMRDVSQWNEKCSVTTP